MKHVRLGRTIEVSEATQKLLNARRLLAVAVRHIPSETPLAANIVQFLRDTPGPTIERMQSEANNAGNAAGNTLG